MSTDLLKSIKDLQDQGASLKESLDELKRPAHIGGDGASLSYWGGEEHISVQPALKSDRTMQSIQRTLPKEYKSRKHWKSCGDMLRDGFEAHKRGQKDEFAKKHADALDPIVKTVQGMSTQVVSDGGALVLPEFNTTIMERVYDNQLWSMTDQYTVTGNNMAFLANAETSRATGSRAGGLQAYWADEGGGVTASKPTLRRFGLKLKKLMVVVYLTDELLSDSAVAIEQYVSRKVSDEFNFMLGLGVFRGTGVGQPLGVFNSPSFLAISAETGQQSGTILTENIDKMWARRLVGGNYAWFHNQDCNPQLDGLVQNVGTAGVPLYREGNSLAAPQPQFLKTARRIETEFNSTVGTVGDVCLADLGQYVTISKGGIAQAVSVHVEFLTDQMAMRFTMRVDGQPWEHSAITPYQGSNTQSAFLGLATR